MKGVGGRQAGMSAEKQVGKGVGACSNKLGVGVLGGGVAGWAVGKPGGIWGGG